MAAGRDVVVAGDLNTQFSERCKTGTELTADHEPSIRCSDTITAPSCSRDGFDDTLALLTRGLVNGLAMRPLTGPGTGRSYANPVFVDSPIDHILVAGPNAARFTEVQRIGTAVQTGSEDWAVFGTDHYPLVAVMGR